jgi:hypothetical protein
MKPYGRSSDALLLGLDGLDGLGAQAVWHQCDVACAEYGTFSLAETQRFGPPDIVHRCVGAGFPRQLPMSVQPGEEVLFLPFWPDYLASRGHSARIN